MTIDQLRQFVSVVKHNNFSKGAEELFLHQSTVSKSIAIMEQELGGPLFLRRTKKLVLSPAGEFLYREAPVIVDKFDGVVGHTRSIITGRSGKLLLLASAGYSMALSSQYRTFRAAYPHIKLSLQECPMTEARLNWEQVLDGTADLGLIPTGELPNKIDELAHRFFLRDEFAVLVSENHPLSGRSSLRLSELSGENVLILCSMRPEPVQMLSTRLFALGLDPLRTEIIDSAEDPQTFSHLLLQVEAGLGITLLPRRIAAGAGWSSGMARLEDIDVPFDLSIIWRKHCPNPSLPMFLECLYPDLKPPSP